MIKFVHGPLKEIPKFSIPIGYPVEFFSCVSKKKQDDFIKIGTLYVYGPDVYSNEVYSM